MGSKRKLGPLNKAIQQEAEQTGIRLSEKEAKIIGVLPSANLRAADLEQIPPHVSLKYFNGDWECFSKWQSSELEAFSGFLKKLENSTWGAIHTSARRMDGGGKNGFGYTTYKLNQLSTGAKDKLKALADRVDPELTFFELRVSQKARVHGFRFHSAFYLVLLDRNHRVFPS